MLFNKTYLPMTMVYRMKFIITHVVAIDRKSFNRLFGILLLQETNLCTYLFLVLAGDGWKVSHNNSHKFLFHNAADPCFFIFLSNLSNYKVYTFLQKFGHVHKINKIQKYCKLLKN